MPDFVGVGPGSPLGFDGVGGSGGGGEPPYVPPFDSAVLVLQSSFETTGEDIDAWNDQSSLADTFTAQGTAPTVSSINGVPAPLLAAGHFDGAGEIDQIFRAAGFVAFWIVQATAASGSSSDYYLCSALLTGADGWGAIGLANDGVVFGFNGGTLGDVRIRDAVNIIDDAPHVVFAQFDPATMELRLRVDDRPAVTPVVAGETPRATDNTAPRVGQSWDLLHQLQGRVAGFVWPAFTTEQIDAFYAWLHTTYGVTVP